MGGPELETLIHLFAKLPGLGPRSARRIVLKLLRERETRLLPLADAIRAAANAVKTCATCGNLDSRDPCTICAAPNRDEIICVVETVADLWALERASVYRGRYHVLGGSLSAIAGRAPADQSPHRNHPGHARHGGRCRDRPLLGRNVKTKRHPHFAPGARRAHGRRAGSFGRRHVSHRAARPPPHVPDVTSAPSKPLPPAPAIRSIPYPPAPTATRKSASAPS